MIELSDQGLLRVPYSLKQCPLHTHPPMHTRPALGEVRQGSSPEHRANEEAGEFFLLSFRIKILKDPALSCLQTHPRFLPDLERQLQTSLGEKTHYAMESLLTVSSVKELVTFQRPF